MTHCLLENTYTGTHSPQGSTDNQGTLSNLCSVRTSKQHELQPCTQASRCRTRDGGRPRGNGHPPEFTHTKCKRMRGSQPLMGERRHLACCLLKFGSPSNIKSNRPRRNTGGAFGPLILLYFTCKKYKKQKIQSRWKITSLHHKNKDNQM